MTDKNFDPVQRAVEAAQRILKSSASNTIFEEEMIALWGRDFFTEAYEEAARVRKITWQLQKAEKPNLDIIDFEPSVDLVLAVVLRKLLKVSLYNRGDFPAKTEGE